MHRAPVTVDRRISLRMPTSPLTGTRGPKKGVHDGGQPECSRNFIGKIRVQYNGLVSRLSYGRFRLLLYFGVAKGRSFVKCPSNSLAAKCFHPQISSLLAMEKADAVGGLARYVSTLFPLVRHA